MPRGPLVVALVVVIRVVVVAVSVVGMVVVGVIGVAVVTIVVVVVVLVVVVVIVVGRQSVPFVLASLSVPPPQPRPTMRQKGVPRRGEIAGTALSLS